MYNKHFISMNKTLIFFFILILNFLIIMQFIEKNSKIYKKIIFLKNMN